MAKVGDEYRVQALFPLAVGEYNIELTDEEWETVDRYRDPEYYRRYCRVADGGGAIAYKASPYASEEENYNQEVWDDDFRILWVGLNLLRQEEMKPIGDAICAAATHYAQEVMGFEMNDNRCYLDVSDSWMIDLTASTNYPWNNHRKHNHSFAWLTGVFYLDDSDNGTVLHATDERDNMYMPFMWPRKETQHNMNHWDCFAERGKMILFPSQVYHSIMNNQDGSIRTCIAFNIWPYGEINANNASMLNYGGQLNPKRST